MPKTAGRMALRKQWGLEDRTVCLTAVRAVPWKGVSELLTWWHRVPASHILIVAGDGPELEAWKRIAAKEGIGERVRFLGRVSREVLAEWYDVADTFVLHTGYEGYPHTVPEAVSRGLPCLVSDQGGNPETQEEFGAYITV
jgi:glycosyltransferase involved in cell wall biosynthesis